MENMEKRLLLALDGAIATRGKNKGKLKSKCPPMLTDAAMMWQALMLHANPYKASIFQMTIGSHRDPEFYAACETFANERTQVLPYIDRDRVALEKMGAW